MNIERLHQSFLDSKGVTTDTRKIEKGQLFFALKGANFNGNKFARKAIEQGAIYAIIDEKEYQFSDKCILVEDVLTCLQNLANFHRKDLNIPLLAITGTNGKTTTKELINAVLKKKYKVGCTKGNLNNHIGVPLTILSLNTDIDIGVVEMGANHIGEIKLLCEIAAPDFGVITNIGKAHIEGFGSPEGVIKAKSELYEYLRINKKTVFINKNDELLQSLSEGIESFSYGTNNSAHVFGEFMSSNPFLNVKWEKKIIESNLIGNYNLNNVLAAICIGVYFKVSDNDIVKALNDYQPENNRSQLTKTANNTLVIDAYNANPTSLSLAVKNFTNIEDENKLLILGDMFELGNSSQDEHRIILELITKLKFKDVYLVGDEFYKFYEKFQYLFFKNTDQLCDYLSESKVVGKTILLKASRGIQLEKAIAFL